MSPFLQLPPGSNEMEQDPNDIPQTKSYHACKRRKYIWLQGQNQSFLTPSVCADHPVCEENPSEWRFTPAEIPFASSAASHESNASHFPQPSHSSQPSHASQPSHSSQPSYWPQATFQSNVSHAHQPAHPPSVSKSFQPHPSTSQPNGAPAFGHQSHTSASHLNSYQLSQPVQSSQYPTSLAAPAYASYGNHPVPSTKPDPASGSDQARPHLPDHSSLRFDYSPRYTTQYEPRTYATIDHVQPPSAKPYQAPAGGPKPFDYSQYWNNLSTQPTAQSQFPVSTFKPLADNSSIAKTQPFGFSCAEGPQTISSQSKNIKSLPSRFSRPPLPTTSTPINPQQTNQSNTSSALPSARIPLTTQAMSSQNEMHKAITIGFGKTSFPEEFTPFNPCSTIFHQQTAQKPTNNPPLSTIQPTTNNPLMSTTIPTTNNPLMSTKISSSGKQTSPFMFDTSKALPQTNVFYAPTSTNQSGNLWGESRALQSTQEIPKESTSTLQSAKTKSFRFLSQTSPQFDVFRDESKSCATSPPTLFGSPALVNTGDSSIDDLCDAVSSFKISHPTISIRQKKNIPKCVRFSDDLSKENSQISVSAQSLLDTAPQILADFLGIDQQSNIDPQLISDQNSANIPMKTNQTSSTASVSSTLISSHTPHTVNKDKSQMVPVLPPPRECLITNPVLLPPKEFLTTQSAPLPALKSDPLSYEVGNTHPVLPPSRSSVLLSPQSIPSPSKEEKQMTHSVPLPLKADPSPPKFDSSRADLGANSSEEVRGSTHQPSSGINSPDHYTEETSILP